MAGFRRLTKLTTLSLLAVFFLPMSAASHVDAGVETFPTQIVGSTYGVTPFGLRIVNPNAEAPNAFVVAFEIPTGIAVYPHASAPDSIRWTSDEHGEDTPFCGAQIAMGSSQFLGIWSPKNTNTTLDLPLLAAIGPESTRLSIGIRVWEVDTSAADEQSFCAGATLVDELNLPLSVEQGTPALPVVEALALRQAFTGQGGVLPYMMAAQGQVEPSLDGVLATTAWMRELRATVQNFKCTTWCPGFEFNAWESLVGMEPTVASLYVAVDATHSAGTALKSAFVFFEGFGDIDAALDDLEAEPFPWRAADLQEDLRANQPAMLKLQANIDNVTLGLGNLDDEIRSFLTVVRALHDAINATDWPDYAKNSVHAWINELAAKIRQALSAIESLPETILSEYSPFDQFLHKAMDIASAPDVPVPEFPAWDFPSFSFAEPISTQLSTATSTMSAGEVLTSEDGGVEAPQKSASAGLLMALAALALAGVLARRRLP